MWTRFLNRFFFTVAAVIWMSSLAAAETLRPFVLGDTPPGDLKQVADAVKLKVTAAGFEIVGSYSPFANAVVICVTNNDLKTTAAKVPNVDYSELKHTAYLPHELMVDGDRVIALRARYRIALNFPDTTMAGAHGFTKIMTAPWGI